MTTYFKIRYTYPENTPDNQFSQIAGMLFATLAHDAKYATIGIETKNGFGEPAYPHVHIHLLGTVKDSAMRKRFSEFKKAQDDTRTGTQMYSIKEEKSVEDECRFFRYPYKECGCNVLRDRQKVPDNFNPPEQAKLAIDERQREIEKALQKRDKEREKNKNREKVFDYLEEKHMLHPYTDVMDIMTDIYQYYADNDKAANPSTILGLSYTLGMKFRVVTARQLAEKTMR